MLQFWASMTSTFLNLKVDHHCSLWPNRVYPTPWNIPSLSRMPCCACFFLFFFLIALAFLLSLLVIYFRFHELLILECTKGKKKTLDFATKWTLHPVSCLQVPSFGCLIFQIRSFFMCVCVCVSLFTWPLHVDFWRHL